MKQSYIVEVDGTFLGVAIRQSADYRFLAVDPRLRPIDGSTGPSLEELRRVARVAYSQAPRPQLQV